MIGSTGVAWVDVLIVLVLLAYAVSGFRAGILVSASSLAGFLAGTLLASYGTLQSSVAAAVVGCIICWIAGSFFRS